MFKSKQFIELSLLLFVLYSSAPDVAVLICPPLLVSLITN